VVLNKFHAIITGVLNKTKIFLPERSEVGDLKSVVIRVSLACFYGHVEDT
jgi:hypothetical protein